MNEPKKYDDVISMVVDHCHQYAVKYVRLENEVQRLKDELRKANEENMQLRFDATKDPILVAVIKDSILYPKVKDAGKIPPCIDKYEAK
jgi:hypothetical protein